MGWIKDMFGPGSSDPDHWNKKFKERMAKEQKEKNEIFDMSQNVDQINERSENNAIEYRIAQKKEREQEVEAEREKEEKAADDLKLVIDTAKLQCDLCTNPIGDLKVNFRTPTIQGKKTATVKEKDMKSLIFKGNCKKSPQSSSPCASVMQLGDWKDIGNMKVQGQFPLLLKSTIKCNYGGTDIKIIDCAQRNEPSDIYAMPMKAEKEKQILNVTWMCAKMEENINAARVKQEVNLLVKTRNFEEGEVITIKVKEATGREISEGLKEVSLSGNVQADGYAELKEQLTLEEVTDKPRDKTLKQIEREEELKTEIYITRNAIDYTRAEWKAYQDKWHDEMEKAEALKNRSFWG
ncbi:DUF4280 domain-containing protein [Flavobacterium bizetiae]|uniref:DUF4280 domain-containing protein n=1 Tax=Flavobacterium bizetiae TaxID=2704140 RepID=UPI0021E9A899|nr:DUF4280 domain-containing protein [Flavobacterium bizetiae]UTN02198.1 DUF4280 domain-containing protein [Flavobacterium bizetiae]